MRRLGSYLAAVFVLGVLMAVLAGCASSPPSRFYTLTSMNSSQSPKMAVSEAHGVILAVGPVVIPDYLDRPQIVTRSGKNELRVDEFHRWGGSLQNDMVRVMIENVSALLPPDRFSVIRWIPPLEAKLPVDYRVAVEVVRFDGNSGEAVSLKVRWALFGKDTNLLLTTESNITEQINGNDYDALVGAMSRALEVLCREIATAVTSLQREPVGQKKGKNRTDTPKCDTHSLQFTGDYALAAIRTMSSSGNHV